MEWFDEPNQKTWDELYGSFKGLEWYAALEEGEQSLYVVEDPTGSGQKIEFMCAVDVINDGKGHVDRIHVVSVDGQLADGSVFTADNLSSTDANDLRDKLSTFKNMLSLCEPSYTDWTESVIAAVADNGEAGGIMVPALLERYPGEKSRRQLFTIDHEIRFNNGALLKYASWSQKDGLANPPSLIEVVDHDGALYLMDGHEHKLIITPPGGSFDILEHESQEPTKGGVTRLAVVLREAIFAGVIDE
jgi:hypothetical protein